MVEIDPVYEYVLKEKLVPFLDGARKWYATRGERLYPQTGIYDVEPYGLTVRVHKTPKHSTIMGVQSFPFVSVSMLQMPKCPGGVRMLVRRLVGDGMTIDEFTVFAKQNLTSTNQAALFLALILTSELQSSSTGRWMYFNQDELLDLSAGIVTDEVRVKAMKYANKGQLFR